MWELLRTEAVEGLASRWLPMLLDASVKGLVVLMAAGAAALAMRRASAAARQLVWFLAMVSLLALPVLSATMPGWRVLPGWMGANPAAAVDKPSASALAVTSGQDNEPVPAEPSAPLSSSHGNEFGSASATADQTAPTVRPGAKEPVPAPASTSGAPSTAPQQEAGVPWQTWASVAWGAGALIALSPLCLGMVSLWRLSRSSRRITDGTWMTLLRRASAELGLRRPVVLLQSDHRPMPMIWGVFRPKLLLPVEAYEWPAARRWVVLLHELAHARRWDCLTKLIAHLACAAYWFNPLAWLAFKRVQTESERACDDLVLAAGSRPPDYAEHILQIASGLRAWRISAQAAIAMARPSKLEGRLLAILDAKRNRRRLTRIGALIAVLLIAGLVVPVSIMRATADKEKPASTSEEPNAALPVDLNAAKALLPALKQSFLTLHTLVVDGNNVEAALRTFKDGWPMAERFLAHLKGTEAEPAAKAAVGHFRNVEKALKAGNLEEAKALLKAFNKVGPFLEKAINKAASARGRGANGPDLARAVTMMRIAKGLMGGVYEAMDSNDVATASALMKQLIKTTTEMGAMVKGTDAEKVVQAGLEVLKPVDQALAKGDVARAKSLLNALNKIGPQLDDAFEKAVEDARRKSATAGARPVTARQVAEAFLSAAAAGQDRQAIRLADPASAVPQQVKELGWLPGPSKLTVVSVHADDAAALAITSKTRADRGREKGVLVLKLIKLRGLWVVTDVDFETPADAQTERKKFRADHPRAVEVPATHPAAGARLERAKVAAARADISRNLGLALDTFEIDTGRYPTAAEGLAALVQQPAGTRGWKGPYIKKLPDDPWGRPYVYCFPGQHNKYGFDLFSLGPDGKAGSDDDIANWRRPAPNGASTSRPSSRQAQPAGRPIVEMWDGGIHILGVKPFPLFLAWADGTVIRRTAWDDRVGARRQKGRLRIGKVDPNQIARLVKEFEKAGWFTHPLKFGLVSVDGPEFRLAVTHKAQRRVLRYPGDDWLRLDEIGPHAGPSRAEVEAFAGMWNRVVAAIAKVQPASWQDYGGVLQLGYPKDEPDPATGGASTQPAAGARLDRVKAIAARTDIAALSVASDTFEVDTGRYPTAAEGLSALVRQPAGIRVWKGPYFKKLPDDPWGRPYVYRFPGQHNKNGFDLFSRGPDGKAGSDDDIANWRRPAPNGASTSRLSSRQAQPAGALEFRVAPFGPGAGKGRVKAADVERYRRALAKDGLGAMREANAPYIWLSVRGDANAFERLVTAERGGRTYLLVSNRPGQVMPAPARGGERWGLKRAVVSSDNSGRSVVRVEFDENGAKLFDRLTRANLSRALAIVVRGEVVSAPTIRARIGHQAVITGRFTERQARELANALRSALPPTKVRSDANKPDKSKTEGNQSD